MLRLNRSQWKSVSTLCSNFSAVFFASLVVPAFTGQFDLSDWRVVGLGIGFTILFAWFSIVSAKEGRL